MDNLRAIVEVLFLDQSFEQVIKSIRTDKRMDETVDERKLQELFLSQHRQYGTDSVLILSRMVCHDWMKHNGRKSVFFLLNRMTQEMLQQRNLDIICRYEHYLRWNAITARLGEDLFTTSFLACHDVEQRNIMRKSFVWKPFLDSDSIQINQILDNGLAELHFHLKGSSNNFIVNWLSLMNTRLAISCRKKWSRWSSKHNLYSLAVKASAIRLYLFLSRFHSDREEIESIRRRLIYILLQGNDNALCSAMEPFYRCINRVKYQYGLRYGKEVFDYAVPANLPSNDIRRYYNIPFIGERRLLYRCFFDIFSNKEDFCQDTTLFYAYLLAKNQFRTAMVQSNDIKGFSNFDMFERRKTMLSETGIYQKLIPFMAVHTTIGNQPIKKLELRITPKERSIQQRQAIRTMNKNISNKNLLFEQKDVAETIPMGYTLHFIKEKEGHLSGRCRNYVLRKKVSRQARSIGNLIRNQSAYIAGGLNIDVAYNKARIIAIDAANSEFNARPEVFAVAYRMLDWIIPKQSYTYINEDCRASVRRTFHVGEDYYDIVDGLRAIDESILFLNLRRGDRLGHVVALGIDADQYYRIRHNTIVLPKQILLDNTAWLLRKMDQYSISDKAGVRNHLQTVFFRLFREVFCDSDPLLTKSSNFDTYYNSWLLRGDMPTISEEKLRNKNAHWARPYEYNSFTQEIESAHNDSEALRICRSYHYTNEVKKRGDGIEQHYIPNAMIEIISELQDVMIDEIQKQGISVENPPTSNLRITDIERYSQHPLVRFNAYGLGQPKNKSRCHTLQASICTDDQGVFSTSLSKEFTLMGLALEKHGCYTQEEIGDWLEHLRWMADKNSFIQP